MASSKLTRGAYYYRSMNLNNIFAKLYILIASWFTVTQTHTGR